MAPDKLDLEPNESARNRESCGLREKQALTENLPLIRRTALCSDPEFILLGVSAGFR